ncbi:hypothetical protein Nepgr_024307 [Nepenthes gracilis]|uniref:RING-type E3 ubiquitin transferase n=1 Tax=Nepenthes gracilis TaxID=150966 RepID=A0AAD3T4D8_NEPGR|nr:hypothetical protein Nepgr_024307 [Nepenthes gracilis]
MLSPRQIERSRYYEIGSSSGFGSIRGQEELTEEPTITASAAEEHKLFVAVGRRVRESKSTLLWALQNSGGNQICIIHVHQPAQTISVLGGKFPISSLGEEERKAHREKERQEVNKILDEYISICSKIKVHVEKLYIEMDLIERGIVELISQHRIQKLVMGGAADSRYSRSMIEPSSRKANYVRLQAPTFCHIWFICKGRLIHTREGIKESNPDNQSGQSSSLRSISMAVVDNDQSKPEAHQGESSSYISIHPEATGSPFFSPSTSIREEEAGWTGEDCFDSPALCVLESGTNDDLCGRLEQAMAEAGNSRRQAFEEATRRRRSEKVTLEAMRKAKVSESLYMEEVSRRKEIEEQLIKRTDELEGVRNQLQTVLQEHKAAIDQKSLLECRMQKSDLMVRELGEKLTSAIELLRNYEKP